MAKRPRKNDVFVAPPGVDLSRPVRWQRTMKNGEFVCDALCIGDQDGAKAGYFDPAAGWSRPQTLREVGLALPRAKRDVIVTALNTMALTGDLFRARDENKRLRPKADEYDKRHNHLSYMGKKSAEVWNESNEPYRKECFAIMTRIMDKAGRPEWLDDVIHKRTKKRDLARFFLSAENNSAWVRGLTRGKTKPSFDTIRKQYIKKLIRLKQGVDLPQK